MARPKRQISDEAMKVLYKMIVSCLMNGMTELEVELTKNLAIAGYKNIPSTN